MFEWWIGSETEFKSVQGFSFKEPGRSPAAYRQNLFSFIIVMPSPHRIKTVGGITILRWGRKGITNNASRNNNNIFKKNQISEQ